MPRSMIEMQNWVEATNARIGEQIKALRGERTAQWLSDATAKLGHRISRTAISEYETGRRKTVPITDLLVISWALEVPAAQLLYPDQPCGEVEFVPGTSLTSIDAVRMFSGEQPFWDFSTVMSKAYEWDDLHMAESEARVRLAVPTASAEIRAYFEKVLATAGRQRRLLEAQMRRDSYPYVLNDESDSDPNSPVNLRNDSDG